VCLAGYDVGLHIFEGKAYVSGIRGLVHPGKTWSRAAEELKRDGYVIGAGRELSAATIEYGIIKPRQHSSQILSVIWDVVVPGPYHHEFAKAVPGSIPAMVQVDTSGTIVGLEIY
jgi:hypothetical protein